ncbi:MAG: ribonuclease P protein component [Nitrosomonas sp.]|nr:ribonuclease P protein component [Nitrosomonas sp.]MCW5607399.1 ribonuclease P protein component [Nitrosomonas sp.]
MNYVTAYSLSRNRRLRNSENFTAVFRFQHQASSLHLQIYAKPNDLSYSRIGLVVSKRFERRAVKRNKIKRLLRETFRTFQKKDTAGMDWVMRLKRPIFKIDSTQFIAEIKLLMHELQQCHD